MPRYIFDQAGSPYELPPSLSESKSAGLANKLSEKREKLAPSPTAIGPSPEEVAAAELSLAASGGSGAGLLDMAESSVYQGAGNIADTYANIRQNVLGDEDYALSPEVDALSDEAAADIKAGFTGREEYNKDIQALTESVAKGDKGFGDYLGIAGQGLALGPRALADSAASGLEILAGTGATAAATALGGPVAGLATGGLVFGKKVKDVVDTAGKVKEAVEDVAASDKVVTLADRIKDGAAAIPKMAVKKASQTSLLTADITEQMRQDYIEEHGTDPSAAWYATNVPITIALNAVEFGILSKAVPKFSLPVKEDMKEAVKFMSKKHSAKAAARILNGSKKVFQSAGAEAGQEYLQTWHEILSSKVDGTTLDTLLTTAVNELGIDENQVESIVGSIIGGFAGGTARAASTAPGVAVGAAVDTVVGTGKLGVKATKAAGRAAQRAKSAASYKMLSEEERATIKEDYDIQQGVVDEANAKLDARITTIEEAKTFEELTADKAIAVAVTKAQDDLGIPDHEMDTPANMKAVKARVTRRYKAKQDKAQFDLDASNIGNVVGQATANVAKMAKETASDVVDTVIEAVPKEVVEKTVAAAVKAKSVASGAIESLGELESSSAYGLVEMGLRGSSKDIKKMAEAAKQLRPRDIKRVANIIKDKNPEAYKKLMQVYAQRKASLGRFGQSSDNVINKETLDPGIAGIAESGTLNGSSPAVAAQLIKRTTSGKIEDKATLAKVRAAIAVYKNTPEFMEEKANHIGKKSMERIEKNLDNAEARLNRKVTAENLATAADKVKTKAGKAYDAAKEKVSGIKEDIDEKADKVTEKANAATEKVKAEREDKREKKVLAKGDASAGLTVLSEQLSPETADSFIGAIPQIVKTIVAEGYTTETDLKDLLAQFPALKDNDKFQAAFEKEFKKQSESKVTEEAESAKVVPTKDPTEEPGEATKAVTAAKASAEFILTTLGCK